MRSDEDGVDPRSWHNGARVLHAAGGKWIAQKFKELPSPHRDQARAAAGTLRLPEQYAPPPMPDSDAAAASAAPPVAVD